MMRDGRLREQILCLFAKTLHGHQYFFHFVIIFLKPSYLSNMQTPIRKMGATKRIALVAHDNKKSELIEWAVYNRTALAKHQLFGTGTTGSLIQAALGQTVTK